MEESACFLLSNLFNSTLVLMFSWRLVPRNEELKYKISLDGLNILALSHVSFVTRTKEDSHGRSFIRELIIPNFPEVTPAPRKISSIAYASIKRAIHPSRNKYPIYGARGILWRLFPRQSSRLKGHLIWINARFLGETSRRDAQIYSAKSKPQRDRGYQVTNYFESPSIKPKVACRPNEHESARLIERRTYLELSRSADRENLDGGSGEETLFVGFRGERGKGKRGGEIKKERKSSAGSAAT